MPINSPIQTVSKSKFKAKALEHFRIIQKTGQQMILLDTHTLVCILVKKKKLNLSKDINEWVANLKFLPNFRPIPIGN